MGIALWCNGSTTDFGSVGHGSSPCSVTNKIDNDKNGKMSNI